MSGTLYPWDAGRMGGMCCPHLYGERILEMACLVICSSLYRQRVIAVGLDASFQMSARHSGRLRGALAKGEPIETRLVNGKGQRCFSRRTFTSLSNLPTEYVTHPDTLAEINRVLSPGAVGHNSGSLDQWCYPGRQLAAGLSKSRQAPAG